MTATTTSFTSGTCLKTENPKVVKLDKHLKKNDNFEQTSDLIMIFV